MTNEHVQDEHSATSDGADAAEISDEDLEQAAGGFSGDGNYPSSFYQAVIYGGAGGNGGNGGSA